MQVYICTRTAHCNLDQKLQQKKNVQASAPEILKKKDGDKPITKWPQKLLSE